MDVVDVTEIRKLFPVSGLADGSVCGSSANSNLPSGMISDGRYRKFARIKEKQLPMQDSRTDEDESYGFYERFNFQLSRRLLIKLSLETTPGRTWEGKRIRKRAG